jgi:beta-phosphoglucomutase
MRITPGIALIFDMDGVIVDSNPVHRESWRVYNRRFGIETSEEMQERMYGKRNDEIVRDFFGEGLSQEQVLAHGAEKEKLYREMMAPRLQQSLVPGVTRLLQQRILQQSNLQQSSGTPVGLATNAERANVDFLLNRVRVCDRPLRSCFQVVVDGQQVARPKPAPDIYLRVAELLDVEPRNCIVFEDSYTGVAAALEAGARVVGVRTTHKEFKNIELSVDDFLSPELETWLEAQKP